MSKFRENFLKPAYFDPKDHWMVGVVWPVTGSKDNEYSVELTNKGFTCDCTGFTFRGKCKHSTGINEKVERAMSYDF
jgi:hypothetical protein|tara:strand:- start:289 stop:519 length:231 start_codon:yes stop_codon:yes gene_type:complete